MAVTSSTRRGIPAGGWVLQHTPATHPSFAPCTESYTMHGTPDANGAPNAGASVQTETATLAGGCFWGMEEILRKVPGVLDTEVGYCGGNVPEATYEMVKSGASGHAEAVQITFNPAVVAFADLLRNWFFRMHDPTTANRQGNDVGTQYRSVIFVHSPDQRETAEAVIREVDAAGTWPAPIVTEVVPFEKFWTAEDDHQDYLQKNPTGYTCHWIR